MLTAVNRDSTGLPGRRDPELAPLPRSFYDRAARRVARDLLGKVVLRRAHGHVLAGRIVEDEAYLGVNDPAAHAAAGRTARNHVLFGPPGHAYVYFIYGNHYCLNFSCEREGRAGSVLIRALEPLAGIEEMARLRGVNIDRWPAPAGAATVGSSTPDLPRVLRLLTSGPGRLCQAMAITRARDNGKDVTVPGDLIVVDDGFRPPKIASTVRVGITRAAAEPWRYIISGNPYVSGKRAGQ